MQPELPTCPLTPVYMGQKALAAVASDAYVSGSLDAAPTDMEPSWELLEGPGNSPEAGGVVVVNA